MKIIRTRKQEKILVSDQDYEVLSQYSWFINNGYAYNKKIGYMHRVILNTPKGLVTDHKNGNRLDNRRENIRVATRSQNAANKPLRNPINWHKNCWRTKITKDGKKYWKYSKDKSKLIAWRKQKAKELYGEFAFSVK